MLGNWDIKVSNEMPQKIATAFEGLNEMVGAEYTFIAYLGCQVVNGTNHAILAEQKLILGNDVKNVVLIIFHETKEGVTISNIERIIEDDNKLGGININVETKINDGAMEIFKQAFGSYSGGNISPFALLGTQVVHGINYIFVCTVTPVMPDAKNKVVIITVNSAGFEPQMVDLLKSSVRINAEKTERTNLRLSAPWTIFYQEVYALFKNDPEVKVMYNDEEPELKLWVRGNDEKAACIARFFPRTKKFGNVILNMSVVGNDGQPVSDVNLPDAMAVSKMFEGNGALAFTKSVETLFGDTLTYIVFKKEVVQYYSDNMFDLYGCTSTLYQTIAQNVFSDTLSPDKCSFCTDASAAYKLGYAFSW